VLQKTMGDYRPLKLKFQTFLSNQTLIQSTKFDCKLEFVQLQT